MADSIHVTLPDGSVKDVPSGTTALEIAKSIGPRLADAALAAKAGGSLIDLSKPLEKDTDLRILTEKDPEALEVFRHSSAHLLAAAVLELFPETKLGHGPPTDTGFFYDFFRPTPFTTDDLEKLEKKMQELVQQNLPYAREFLPREQGLEEFKKDGDFMKCHFIEQFTKPDEKISIYRTGKFTDFCRGPHIPSTGRIKAFKLFNVAGAFMGRRFIRKKASTNISSSRKKPKSATIAY
jgi:threonyl-tRNA synthetase